jgi:hypothetical protein
VPEKAQEPADFEISTLSVTPDEVMPGQTVTVSAVVINTGGTRGKYTVVFKVDGVIEDEKELLLDAGAEYKVNFELDPDSLRTYRVEINGLTGAFTVQEWVESTIMTEEPEESAPSGFAFQVWQLIAISAVVIVLIIGMIVFFVMRRRRTA